MRPVPAPPTTRRAPVAPTDLAARLRLVVTRLARRLRHEADLPGISPTQLSALATISREGPLTLGEVAAHEHVQPPTVTAAVGRLEERGLVRRFPDPDDRRATRVEATAAGRDLLAVSRSRKTAYLEQRLRALPADERAAVRQAVEVLERLIAEERDA